MTSEHRSVQLKLAASLDGKTALLNGQSQWITGGAARKDGHNWRARSDAILTGIGTVLEDDPRLDIRLADGDLDPPPIVVVDSRLETPPSAHIFIAERARYIYAAVENSEKKAALEAAGATVVHMPAPGGKVDLAAMLDDLARRGMKRIHVEAGHKLSGSFIRERLVDEFLVYLAPKMIGDAQGMATFGPLSSLADALELEFVETRLIGPDLFIRARVLGRQTK